MCSGTRYCDIADNFSGLKRRLGDKRISDSRRGYFALGCCDRAYGGLMRRLDRDEDAAGLNGCLRGRRDAAFFLPAIMQA